MIRELLFRKKRKDRWWRYLVLSKAYTLAQRCPRHGPETLRSLQQAMRQLGYGPVSGELSRWWAVLVDLGAERQPELDSHCLAMAEQVTAELDPEHATTFCWLDLSRLCIGIGFFQLARLLREKSLDQAIAEAALPSTSLSQATRACYVHCELGAFDNARHYVGRMADLGQSQSRLEQARWFISTLEGASRTPGTEGELASSPATEAFGREVQGRTIAVVGPVASDLAQGTEIDDHDAVVKFNYRGGDKGRDPRTQGRRIDLSYYNNDQAKTLSEGDFDAVFSQLSWAVFVNEKGRRFFPGRYTGLRTVASLQWLLLDTHFNAGPNVILDLLRFSPASITVYNTDLMLSAGRFAGYQPDGAEPINYTRSFIKTHDPLLQYQVMHRLWRVGHITGDQRFERVMTMGLTGYLDELQKAYGAVSRALY